MESDQRQVLLNSVGRAFLTASTNCASRRAAHNSKRGNVIVPLLTGANLDFEETKKV